MTRWKALSAELDRYREIVALATVKRISPSAFADVTDAGFWGKAQSFSQTRWRWCAWGGSATAGVRG